MSLETPDFTFCLCPICHKNETNIGQGYMIQFREYNILIHDNLIPSQIGIIECIRRFNATHEYEKAKINEHFELFIKLKGE